MGLIRTLKTSILLIVIICRLDAQQDTVGRSDGSVNHTLIPVAFYLPETSLGLGGTGIISTRSKGERNDSRVSQILYSGVYTLKNQLLLYIPFEIFKNEERDRYKGEIGYYRYFYNFYGLGPETEVEDKEIYSVNYPRIYFQYLRRVFGQHHFGLGFKYDYFDLYETKEDGIIQTENLLGIDGKNTWMTSANYLFDNRDNIFYPSKGVYFDAGIDLSDSALLSRYDFTRWTIDARYYRSLHDDWILASQLYFSSASRETPFYYLPYVSSTVLSRGFADRRFIDYQMTNLQSELRFPIAGRFYGVTFVSVANVGSQIATSNMKYSGGVGIRYELAPETRNRLRLDVAISEEGLNFYITANEAF